MPQLPGQGHALPLDSYLPKQSTPAYFCFKAKLPFHPSDGTALGHLEEKLSPLRKQHSPLSLSHPASKINLLFYSKVTGFRLLSPS